MSVAAKSVVVTGAAGFAANHLARHLSARGHQVYAIARHPADPVSAAQRGLHWVEADLMSPSALPRQFDTLVHCAAEIPARCSDPELLYHRNFDVTQTLFSRAAEIGANVIYCSSMSAYGTISVPVITEDTPPGALDPYGRAKRDGEVLLGELAQKHIPSGLSLRLPGVVGKGSHHNFLSDVMSKILNGVPVAAKNPEARFNNIVHVSDFCTFIESWIDAPRPGHAITNLAALEPMTIRGVITTLFEASGMPLNATFEDGGKAPFLISLDRALSLGYKPSTVKRSLKLLAADYRGTKAAS